MTELFHDLIDVYRRNSAKRVREMRVALADLAESGALDSLNVIVRHFHGFSGLGQTYGYPRISELGHLGETAARALSDSGRMPDRATLDRWSGMILEIETLLRSDPEPGAVSQTSESPEPLTEVLLIEDDDEMRYLLSAALQQRGSFVRTASSRVEAVAELDVSLPDVLLVDVMLPDGAGYDVVEHLRTLPSGDLVAAIVISARHEFLDRVEAVRCGADAFFEKPIDMEILSRRIDRLLERRTAENVRVLSVEDDPDHVAQLAAILQGEGYVYLNCRDPLEFEAYLIEFEPDLVIMDVTLGRTIDGYDLSKYLRQNDRWAGLPVIFLTAERQQDTRLRVARSGGDDYIPKPIDRDLLLTTIATRVERARIVRSQIDRDGLTGLLTRTAFMDRAETILKEMTRHPEHEASLVLIDLDHFKQINDQWGHLVGDQVLVSFSTFMRKRLRQTDTIARYGGEEFALIVNHLDPSETGRLIEKLLDEFQQQGQTVPGETLRVTFSAGVAAFQRFSEMETTLGDADDALYRAKNRGRAQIVVVDPKSELSESS